MKRGPHGDSPCNLGMSGPPEKRRKTNEELPELWDENDDFTQDVLQNIDDIVASQVPAEPAAPKTSGSGSGGSSNGATQATHCGTSSSGIGKLPHTSGQLRPAAQPQVYKVQPKSHPIQGASRYSPNPGQADTSALTLTGMGSCSTASRSEGYHTLTAEGLSTPVPAAQHGPVKTAAGLRPAAGHPYQSAGSGERTGRGSSSSDSFTGAVQKELQKAKEQREQYKKEFEKLLQNQVIKDGEIKMLRKSLTTTESELTKHKQQKTQQQQQETRERTDREKTQEAEIERLRTQLQFKEHEVVELKNTYKRREQQSRLGSGNEGSPRSPMPAAQSPQASKRRGDARSPRPSKGAFPTSDSFQESPTRLRKSTTKVTESKEKDAKPGPSAPVASTSKPAVEQPKEQANRHTRRNTLSVSHPRGQVSGRSLVTSLLSCSGDMGATLPTGQHSILKLLEPPAEVLDLSGMKLGRDKNMLLSPVAKWTQQSYPSTSSSSAGSDPIPVVDMESHSLAHQSLTALLQPSPRPTQLDNLLSSSATSAISLLPLVEDYISRYMGMMQAAVETSISTPTGSWGASTESSLETITSSLQSFMLGRASYANKIEGLALCALQVLEVVVGRCCAVRTVLMCDREDVRNCVASNTIENMDTNEPGTSKQGEPHNHSAGQSVRDHNNFNLSSLDGSMLKIVQECSLLRKVMKLANPKHFKNKAGNGQITATALSIMCQLASTCQSEQMDKFQLLFSQESLANCLQADLNMPVADKFCLAHRALKLLGVLVQSETLVKTLCSASEDCLLSTVYSACSNNASSFNNEQRRELCKQMIQLLSNIAHLHKFGGSLLVEANCKCSTEVVKSVIVILHNIMQTRDEDAQTLHLLRQGADLLCCLSMHDRLFLRHRHDVEHQYVVLICGLDALFKRANVSEDEVSLVVENLWDFEQEYPGESGEEEGEADSQNNNNNSKARASSSSSKN